MDYCSHYPTNLYNILYIKYLFIVHISTSRIRMTICDTSWSTNTITVWSCNTSLSIIFEYRYTQKMCFFVETYIGSLLMLLLMLLNKFFVRFCIISSQFWHFISKLFKLLLHGKYANLSMMVTLHITKLWRYIFT